MSDFMTQSIVRILGVFALVLGLSGPALAQNGPPGNNPGQPFDEILAQIAILNDKLNELLDKSEGGLRGVTQNWDKQLDATNGDGNGCNSDRFTCLFGDTVVRDNETGLVWDRDPDTGTRSWTGDIGHCAQREVGGRKGWSLPMREQLASLVDDDNNDPALPTDHPFLSVQSANYWSASTDATNPADAWLVNFGNGGVFDSNKFNNRPAWCVRGGQTYDGQDVQ